MKMLSSTSPRIRQPEIEYIQIGQMDFRDYSRFIIEGLNGHVGTSHCLIVQGDGFIVDPARWRDQFLDYDYVGAPWPEYVGVHFGNGRLMMDENRVGNGGFSFAKQEAPRGDLSFEIRQLSFSAHVGRCPCLSLPV